MSLCFCAAHLWPGQLHRAGADRELAVPGRGPQHHGRHHAAPAADKDLPAAGPGRAHQRRADPLQRAAGRRPERLRSLRILLPGQLQPRGLPHRCDIRQGLRPGRLCGLGGTAGQRQDDRPCSHLDRVSQEKRCE